MRDLDLMTVGRKCEIWNFEIGHKEVGKVVFPGLMDVYGANLDKFCKCYPSP